MEFGLGNYEWVVVAYILNSVFDSITKKKKKKERKEKKHLKYNNSSSKLGSNQAFKNVHQPIKKKKKKCSSKITQES